MKNVFSKLIFFLLVLNVFSACLTPFREPTSATPTAAPFRQLPHIFPRNLTHENCSDQLEKFKKELATHLRLPGALRTSIHLLKDFEDKNFYFRKMTSSMNLSEKCTLQLRDLYSLLRELRDITAETIHEEELPRTMSFQLGKETLSQFPYRSGDILLTRGSSFLSATISQVSTNPSQYSHIAYVYVDPHSKKAFTMESYPNKGARIYPMDQALKNDNIRIQLFRPKDEAKAVAASTYMYNTIYQALKKNRPMNYDYLYNADDQTRLSCVEVLQQAYAVTDKQRLPALPSRIEIKNQRFLKSIGLKQGDFFVPADIETDSRFELLWEWTDFQQTLNQRMKNIVVKKIFLWISEEDYQLVGNFKSLAANVLLLFRRQPTLWNLFTSNFGGKDIPPEIPRNILTSIMKTNDVGKILLSELVAIDKEMFTTQERHLTTLEMELALEKFRTEDKEAFLNQQKASLHMLFRPAEMTTEYNN